MFYSVSYKMLAFVIHVNVCSQEWSLEMLSLYFSNRSIKCSSVTTAIL